jgi:hypothetical protein
LLDADKVKSKRQTPILKKKERAVFMLGLIEEAENKRKEKNLKAVGLLAEPAVIKAGQNLVEEKMLLKAKKENADLLVGHVKGED